MTPEMVDMMSLVRQAALRYRNALLAMGIAVFGLGLNAVWSYPLHPWPLSATAAMTVLCIAVGLVAMEVRNATLRIALRDRMKRLMLWERVPVFFVDQAGIIQWRNMEAEGLGSSSEMTDLKDLLSASVAEPAKFLADLQNRAKNFALARETKVVGTKAVHFSVVSADGSWFLWRVDETRRTSNSHFEALPIPALTYQPDQKGGVEVNAAMRGLLGRPVNKLTDVFLATDEIGRSTCRLKGNAGPLTMSVQWSDCDAGRLGVFLPKVSPSNGNSAADLFEALPVPLLKLTATGEILQANRGARDLLEDDLVQGQVLSELMSGLGRSVLDWLREASEGRGLNRAEFLQVNKQNKDLFVQVSLKPLPKDDKADLVAVLNDATELKTLEAQFVQSQKMQAIGQLAGGVAHDFNNLLTAISGHCDLLLLRHDQGDPEYGDLVQIHQNTNRAASLVGQLLAFSRKQTLQPEVVELPETLAELTHLLNRLVGEKISLALSHDSKVAPIRADKRQLEQVIMNLVVNARDAMPEGGEITIATEALTLDREIRRNRASIPVGDYSVIKVIDHGVGIPGDKLSKVFEPFYTTKRTGEGTGLGLSTAYGIVKQTGGFIFVESEVGKGTTFLLYFPAYSVAPVKEVAEPAQPDAQRPAMSGGVVLLVEDEAPVRAFASRALRLRGHTVLEAENAEDALEQLKDETLEVDVFLTDVVMPGMDGPSWVKEALKTRPDTRVVFVSGYAEEALADHRKRIPNSVFLPKPFSLNDLTKTVQSQLGQRPQ